MRYLGADVSDGWLYGGTGHAFINNIHSTLCRSGPTAWRTAMLHHLGANLGYRTRGVFGWKHELDDGFRAKQRDAYEFVRDAIDAGLPCYGWQLEIPDFYVICGYDDAGYYYSGYGQPVTGPLAWDKLGDWGVALIEVYRLELSTPVADREVVKRAIDAVLEVAHTAARLASPGYTAGPEGFEVWARALESGTASHHGHIYNAQAWGECRRHGVEFLKEARGRIAGVCDGAFDDAVAAYSQSRDALAQMVALHPPSPELDLAVGLESAEAAVLARAAGAAEGEGLAALRAIGEAL